MLQAANVVVMPSPQPGQAAVCIICGMLTSARITGMAGIVACLGLMTIVMSAAPVIGQTAPQEVISDTPQYCLQLLDRVSELVRVAPSPPPEEVTHLSSEGQRMCDQGQTRGGILRLRRAIMLMMHWSAGP